jgi:hypothetical protein
MGGDLDGYSHERPAFVADVGPFATGAHIIIICQINIKDQLPLHRHKLSVAFQPWANQTDQGEEIQVKKGIPRQNLFLGYHFLCKTKSFYYCCFKTVSRVLDCQDKQNET